VTEDAKTKVRGSTGVARGCAYYLSRRHNLIKRHVESVDLNYDHTATWTLQIDLELPTDPAAFLGPQDGEGSCHFLFPLLYLRKTDARTGFEAHDEKGVALSIPTRKECNRISGHAAAGAAVSLQEKFGVSGGPTMDQLSAIMEPIAASAPFQASLTLNALCQRVGIDREEDPPLTLHQVEVGRAWQKARLTDVLDMLVDNTLIWAPLFGRPGERSRIVVTKQISLARRTFVRWIFGEMKRPKKWLLHPLRTLRARSVKDDTVLLVGDKKYGLRGRRISFSAMTERLGLPLAWAPCEFEFPSIYTKRCSSYHFELRCPPGRSPRELRPAAGTPIAERGAEAASSDSLREHASRTTLTSTTARHDRLGNDLARDMWFRVSVGVGDGAFPSLWFLTGVITAVMLWLLADNNPVLEEIPSEIIAGILLVVPALAAGLAFSGDDDVPVTRLLGGARVLLLITGLSAVGAAAVVAGAKPYNLEPNWSWTICAIAATTVTVPLGTSWLLSSQFVWGQLKKLRSWHLQRVALSVGLVLAAAGVGALIAIGSPSVPEGTVAVYLLLLTVGIAALANNRAAMPVGESRRNVVMALLVTAVTCVALACIELRAAIDPGPGPQPAVEVTGLGFLVFAFAIGQVKTRPIEVLTHADDDEIHVSPQAGRELLAEEAVAELAILRRREQKAALEDNAGIGPTK
jgi:hypothetical protein